MKYEPEKYRRRSIRLRGYDYSQSGAYFITICTHNRECILGNVTKGEVTLSLIGEKARKFWLELPNHFENVCPDEFIVMPNHIHGVIIIMDRTNCRGVKFNAPTKDVYSTAARNYYSHISPKRNTLSVIIRTYKSALTHWCKENGIEYFKWQRNYYEHIIRNEKQLYPIRQYIQNNPLKWEWDRENPLSKNLNLDLRLYWKEIYERK